ncbi:MAG: DNA mismatch repair endonuclease MutL [Chloroflexota bacterium]|nr:DNA mismatch repair endonuclease MutL [Chloroflexota bacterium]
MPILRLTDETIGKIAAGEVVERPVSVVKELVENSIDAAAREISVAIEAGGSVLIQVTDDGAGMGPDEVSAAIERHGTSKLTSFEDLSTLTTLGFRGEALPSIAAISRFSVRSRPPGHDAGAEVIVEHGLVRPVRAVAMPPGTVVTVRDLFGNVPARRAFLRQPGTEATYIGRMIGAYASAYPGIRFRLTHDGRQVLATDGQGDQASIAIAIHGQDFAGGILPLPALESALAVPGVSVSGWVGLPSLTKSHRQAMHFFVNGRWIQHRALGFALEEAYHSLLMVGRHPVATIHLTLDPAAVDVNVHPTKAEVRFHDERAAARAVQRTAHAALAGAPRDHLPTVSWERPLNRSDDHSRPLPMAIPTLPSLPPADPPPVDHGPAHRTEHPSGLPMLRVLGQIGASFIIAEGPAGMYLIDQHAAHERVLFERIMGQLAGQQVDRQPLLEPMVIDLTPEQLAMCDRSRDELAAIGFEVDSFGDGAVVVRSVPVMATGGNLAGRFRAILDELVSGGNGTSWLEAVAISTACHTSIRAGQPLSIPEMRELVADLERSEHPRACGHGRPTMIHLTQDEMARQFSRR